jgi:hypothetical protein
LKSSSYIFLAGVLFLAVTACETNTPTAPVSSPKPGRVERTVRVLIERCQLQVETETTSWRENLLRVLSRNGVTVEEWCECGVLLVAGISNPEEEKADQFLVDFGKYDNLLIREPYKTRAEDAEVYCAAGKNPT